MAHEAAARPGSVQVDHLSAGPFFAAVTFPVVVAESASAGGGGPRDPR
jgi:hypothetical protein